VCALHVSAQVDTLDRQRSPEPPPALPRLPYSPLSDPFPYDAYKHSVEFDSISNKVRLFESVFGEPIGQPQTMSLDEYLARQRTEAERRMWEERVTKYEFDAGQFVEKDDLERIIGKGTQIDIPIPQNPITSIFGAPTISINVNGSVNVSAGWQWDSNNLTSISSLGSTQSAPFFNQNIQVAVSGRVGDKLKLTADFDTQRSFDFDNQLKIAFGGGPGGDDDILQGVEAGAVQLQTPSTLIGGSQTLFGIKTSLKFGPLFLTTIASQKRGERKTVSVSGGSVKTQVCLKPYQYAQNHFWLDTAYKSFYDIYYRSTPPAATPDMAPWNVTDIEVYEQVKDQSVPGQFKAIAYADLEPISNNGLYPEAKTQPQSGASSGTIQPGSFIRLEQGRGFEFDRQLGTVVIKSLQQDKMYAVAYRTSQRGTFGDFSNTRADSTGRPAVLKLIYVNNLLPSFTSLWTRQMKNIYPLQGVRNVNLDDSKINITFGVPPDTSEALKIEGSPRLVTVLGVDRSNSANEARPDGEFDIRSPYFFDPARGEIIFPSTEPFRKRLRDPEALGANAEPFVLDAIYDMTAQEAQRDTKVSKYSICADVAGTGGNKINLGAFNLAPSSIKVSSNGQPLQEGLDYRVDPVFGEVTLLSARANSATGNLTIEYEQNDFYTIAQKTLLGLRADYDLLNKRSIKSKLGMTFMRYGQTTPTGKVQIYGGDEPVTNLMLGFDGFVDYTAGWLTKAIDALPLIDTKEASTLNLRGEWAMVSPNPNTKESLVASDEGKGAAYIDDFESTAKRQIQLGVNYTLWRPASPPVDNEIGDSDTARLAKKGQLFWYNITPAQDKIVDIWPNKDVAQSLQTTSVMDLVFDPTRRGMYNMDPAFENLPDRGSVWGGMMRALSFYSTNLDEENIDYIEITMRVDNLDELDLSRTHLYVDLGQISEDVIPNLSLNTEDGITTTNPQPDDILNEGEDVGIDSLSNAQEIARYGAAFPGDPDPAHDDYSFTSRATFRDFANVNGMEGNVGQERGPFPDTEDLNGNKSLDIDNTYFRYEINLDPDPLRNPQIIGVGGPVNAGQRFKWLQYRIPIRTNFQKVGNPSFNNVQFARVVVKSPTLVRVRMAEFNLVGSDWRNLDVPDSVRDPKLDIAFVNLEDNAGPPDFYTIPPGVEQEREYSNNVLKNEQSLSLRVQCLDRGESRAAVRIRPRAFDLFNYKRMKFFLHGGGDMDQRVIDGQSPKVVAFMRFGWDSLNYYEYRTPLVQGWNEHIIEFADLAAIKQQRGTGTPSGLVSLFPVPGRPTDQFAVRGLPSLTRVQFISFGVINQAYPGCLTTTLWVDELRAVGAEDANDWAATVSADVKLADLGNVNFNASQTNPNFHRLEERFGNRVETKSWAVNSVFQLEKFLPNVFKGSSIPFTYNHSEQLAKPLYIAESDVEVKAATERLIERPGADPVQAQRQADSLRTSSQTLSVTDAFTFNNFHLNFQGEVPQQQQFWWIRDVFNRLTFGYSYNQVRERSPLIEQRFRWEWDFKGQYSVNIPSNFDLQPFRGTFDSLAVLNFWKDFRINFLPNNFSANAGVHRDRTTEQLRNLLDPSPVIRNFYADRAAQFNWQMTQGGLINLTTEYSVTGKSSLTHLETDFLGQQRPSGEIAGDLFFNEGRLFNFGRDNNLTQQITFNTRPRIPFIPDVDRFVTPSARYTVNYQWNDQLTSSGEKGSFTKSAQWNSSSTLGLNVRLRQISDAIWGDPIGGRRQPADTTATDEGTLAAILRYLIKIPLLEYETINLQFQQSNTAKNPGVVGATGVTNLWGRTLLGRSESADFGPGAAYQLGLIDDPHGGLDFGFKSAFPFIDVQKRQGIRAPNIYVQDDYTQDNNLTASTNRALWPGAELTLNWKTKWGYRENFSVTTDGEGIVTTGNRLVTGNLSRSYLSLPNFLFFSAFNNDIEGVVDEYARRKAEVTAPVPPPTGTVDTTIINAYNRLLVAYNRQLTDILSETFEQQLEVLNWLPGDLGKYLPRLNWTFQWNGLEKLPFLSGWAQSASIRHVYNGEFNRNFRVTEEGEVPETQTVRRGFSPLVQLNVTGKPDVFDGTATGSISYNTTTDFNLVAAARSEISKELKSDLQLQLSYQKRGMNVPLFGLALKNDIEFALSFTYGRNNRKRFNLTEFKPEGNNDGSTRINLRPSVRYSLSTAVTASAFVSYEATIPDGEGSRDIRRSTTKVGLDLRVGISGGR
jgi:cell surface protein SprA